jgi:hypothetical protein
MDIKTQILVDELQNDPLTRNYAGMSNAQATASLNTADRVVERTTLSASEMFEAIDPAEYTSLSAADQDRVKLVLSLGDSIQISVGTKARTILEDVFAGVAGTNTRPALGALVNETKTRGEEIGFGKVREGDVQDARRFVV